MVAVGVFAAALGVGLVVVAVLAALALLHRRCLARIPFRIHVAGSRGKSTTTRLIAAGLRRSGVRTIARTTGTKPRLVLAAGDERPWRRWGPPSIRELTRLVAIAARERAEALVLECMGIRPEALAALERHLVRATHVVITNARSDHLEDLGTDPDAVAAALAHVVPTGGRLFLTDEAALPVLVERARALATSVEVVATRGLPPGEADRRLALAVCRAFGVGEDEAARAFEEAAADPGAFSVTWIERSGKRVRFANAFACNDVASLKLLLAEQRATLGPPSVVVLNVREDRPARTRQFLAFLASLDHPFETLFVAGGGPVVRRQALRAGLPASRIRRLSSADAEAALDALVAAAAPEAVIWGVGNYRGLGEALADVVLGEAVPC